MYVWIQKDSLIEYLKWKLRDGLSEMPSIEVELVKLASEPPPADTKTAIIDALNKGQLSMKDDPIYEATNARLQRLKTAAKNISKQIEYDGIWIDRTGVLAELDAAITNCEP